MSNEVMVINPEKADRKATNIAHQRKINREALNDLMSCHQSLEIDKVMGQLIITAIAHKKIKHITINY